jgi:hypothetical protein
MNETFHRDIGVSWADYVEVIDDNCFIITYKDSSFNVFNWINDNWRITSGGFCPIKQE